MPTETTVRDGDSRPGNRSPTLQDVPTEPAPASPAVTEAGDVRTDPTMNISPNFNPNMPPPPRGQPATGVTDPKASAAVRVAAKPGFPKAGPVTNLVLAPRSDEPPRGGAPGQPPPNRTGPKDRPKGTGVAAALQAVQSSQDKAQQIAAARAQDLAVAGSSASAAAITQPTAAQAQAAATQAAIEAQKKRIEDLRAQQNAQLQQDMQIGKAPGTPPPIGAIGAARVGTRTPIGANPTTPGRRQSSRSPGERTRRRDRDRGRSGSRRGG